MGGKARQVLAVAAVLGCVGLLIGSSVGAGARSGRVITVRAPFPGHVVPGVYLYYYGCAHARAPTPVFALSTGDGRLNTSTWARSCPAASSDNGYATEDFAVSVFVPYHAGLPTYFVNVTWGADTAIGFSAGLCHPQVNSTVQSGCARITQASVQGSASLIDATTGHVTNSPVVFPGVGGFAYNTSTCYRGNCSVSASGTSAWNGSSGNFSWPIPVHAKLNATHSYQILLYFSVYTGTECLTFGKATLSGCSLTAFADFSPPARGVRLVSIVVT